ncbi:MAG: hypothetical protein JWO70_429 [Betaproteobacteria bacterium]|nr:hypothetical protein [Betaproteobacteria bacterium]
MFGHDAREDLARVCRILAHHEMIDLWGHVSLRVPRSNVLMVTPRFGRNCLPRRIEADHILVTDLSGRVIEGSSALPPQFAVDVEVYRQKPDTGAVMFASPMTAMAAAIAERALAPLTHMESSVSYALGSWQSNALANAAAEATALARTISVSSAVNQRGIGAWTAGKDPLDCLTTMYHLEYLAQANLVSAPWQQGIEGIAKADSDKLWGQFSGHHHYAEFFISLDPGVSAHPYDVFAREHAAGGEAASALKAAIAFSCRALWERDTLVAFLEHISHRLPRDDRFLMTASKNFGQMLPRDICLLDYDANWIAGPKPPNFKWFHAQLLAERRDALAVVHTHDLLGRVYALGERTLTPCHRTGLGIATRPLPAYPRCDLIVDPEVRRRTLDALGTGPIVHEIGHGTDFVATTLEQATVDAIQREAFLRMHNLAERFGTPQPMADGLCRDIKDAEFDAADWWSFHTCEVGAPRRSAGGL